MNWKIISLLILIVSPVMYLFIRKAKESGKSVEMQNLYLYFVPTIFLLSYNIIFKVSMQVEFKYLIMMIMAAIFFSLLGNICSLKALTLAQNPGYSLIIQKSYTIYTTIASIWLFNSEISIKSILAIIIILIFISFILIEKSDGKVSSKKWIPYTFGAFFAFGSLSLTTTFLGTKGYPSTVINFYIFLTASIILITKSIVKKTKIDFSLDSIKLALEIGILHSIFNYLLLNGYNVSPNPGYISAVNASSMGVLTIFYKIFYHDTLTLKKVIGSIGILLGLLLLFI